MNTTSKLPTMKTRGKVTAGAISIGAVAAVIASVYAFAATGPMAGPEPTPTPTPIVGAYIGTDGAVDEEVANLNEAADRVAAAEAEAARLEAERVAAEQAAAQAAADAAAEEAARAAQDQQQTSQGDGGSQTPSQPGPIRCPAGSTANSNDGYNDTSCFPDICFSIVVPNPDHPECDVAFRP